MMKAKISKGNGFRGAMDYCMDKKKDFEILESNMDGQTPRELSAEFQFSRQLRPEIKKPVWHCSLSCPAGEKLSAEKWAEVAEDHMKNMGFDLDKHQYSVIRHKDTDYDHVHIVANKVGMNGYLWKDSLEVYRAIESTQELEKAHGLEKTTDLDRSPEAINQRREKKPLTRIELQMASRNIKAGKKELPPRMAIQRVVDNSLKKTPDMKIFLDDLKQQNISIRIYQAKTGKISGIKFIKDGVFFKGSQLGKGYSWKGINEKGLNYDQKRDRGTIERNNEAFGRAHERDKGYSKGDSSRASGKQDSSFNGGNHSIPERDAGAERKQFENPELGQGDGIHLEKSSTDHPNNANRQRSNRAMHTSSKGQVDKGSGNRDVGNSNIRNRTHLIHGKEIERSESDKNIRNPDSSNGSQKGRTGDNLQGSTTKNKAMVGKTMANGEKIKLEVKEFENKLNAPALKKQKEIQRQKEIQEKKQEQLKQKELSKAREVSKTRELSKTYEKQRQKKEDKSINQRASRGPGGRG